MEDTLKDGQKIIALRLSIFTKKLLRKPKSNKWEDFPIVIATFGSKNIVKRCMGFPRTIISIDRGTVFLDKQRVQPSSKAKRLCILENKKGSPVQYFESDLSDLNYYSRGILDSISLIDVNEERLSFLRQQGYKIVDLRDQDSIFNEFKCLRSREPFNVLSFKNLNYLPDIQLLNDQYFLLGDNWNLSQDSRTLGVINFKNINWIYLYTLK
jgi:hypothetical protein